MRLAEHGQEVVVFEREPMAGGLAAGFPLGNAHLEKFYHHLFRTDRRAISLINELGLGDKLVWKKPVTAVLRNDRLWNIDSARAVMAFEPIPFPSRVRLGASLAYLKTVRTGRRFEGKTASQWIESTMGAPLTTRFGSRC